ncbi:hypothetical protein F5876DRAFT_70116 [Lentinula aff. lateritia]|uniref:Uncharacterized protein n=1 Tax=Lentinula aff. lateritia TaxID=2804960 RepID=A0ACC1TKI1_9AGAR|nr:hypothetical protein F5876DRAFT_70116 [Lentinula aff. lateritia]
MVHAITPSREAYLLAGAQGASESHTTEWVKVSKKDHEIHCMTTTAKVREGLTEETPTVADLDDCIHSLHNTVGDISKLKAFKEPLDIMKRIAKYFRKSGLATNCLLEYRRAQMTDLSNDKVLRIQKPGGTRFGSLHTSAMLLLPNLPAIQTLVAEKQIKFLKAPKIQKLFAHSFSGELKKFKRSLHCYTTIINPFIRSLWSLEAADANASDVAFFSNELYFAAFLLDPRYPSEDFLKANIIITIPPAATQSLSPPVPRESPHHHVPFTRAYDRLKAVLKKNLKDILDLPENDSEECREKLFGECTKVAIVNCLKTQIKDFWYSHWPFNSTLNGQTSLEWWRRLQRDSNASVIAFLAVEIFSILVNSMSDERTNSYVTWLNLPLRGNQLVGTVIDMIQVGQWYRKGSHFTSLQITIKKQPVVGFRFIEPERLEKIKEVEIKAAEDAEELEEEEELEDENNAMDDDEEIDIDTPLPTRQLEFKVDRDIDLSCPALRDLISVKPVLNTNLRAPIITPRAIEEPDWSW